MQPSRDTNSTSNNYATLVGLFCKRYYKLLLVMILCIVFLCKIKIVYLYYGMHIFIRNILDLNEWRHAYFPPPLKMVDASELSCPLRPDIGPIDAVYTWVNGSDPELIKSIAENLAQNPDSSDKVLTNVLTTAKETKSKRFYGEIFFLIYQVQLTPEINI